MDTQSLYQPLRIVALVVLGLMLVAVLYGGVMSLSNWTGIGV